MADEPQNKTPPAAPYKWEMVVDLDRCTGCQACMVACHAENNVRLSDEAESAAGRSISWIRIERYWEGDYPDVKVKFIPVLCQHCSKAPCEPVCPVYASYHTPDGLNAQVYNRCVGTRFCANNCPYTVRYFTWFTPEWPSPLNEQLNPDVSIRTSGIMEKCTFCVQRIRRAQDTAKDETRAVRDGEIQPACAQACAAKVLVFGDLRDPDSEVSRLTNSRRGYRLLEELGTRPRVVYLREADA